MNILRPRQQKDCAELNSSRATGETPWKWTNWTDAGTHAAGLSASVRIGCLTVPLNWRRGDARL